MKSPFRIWRSSLVYRVTGTIVALSIILIALLGSALYSRVSAGIFDEKLKLLIDGLKNLRKTRKSNNHCSKCDESLNNLESCEIQSEIDLYTCNKKFRDFNKQNECFSKNFTKNIDCSVKYYKCKNEYCIKNKEKTKNNTSKINT